MTARLALFARPFYFLRHGETESNAQGVIGGQQDVDLTPLGCEQARCAAELLCGRGITHVYSSPLRRALHTAEPIANCLGLPVTVINELAERNWGVLEGKPRQLRARGMTPDGAESSEAYASRALTGLARVSGDAPLVVAHSGIFRVLCRTLDIIETEAPVTNALPMLLTPLDRGWRLEPILPGDPI